MIVLGAKIERDELKEQLPEAYQDYLELFDNVQLKSKLDTIIATPILEKKGFKI